MDYFALFCFILAFFAGVGTCLVWQWQVKRTSLSIVRDQAGAKGREARKEQDNDLLALISDASLAFKAGREAGEDVTATAGKVVPGLIAKYPMVIAKHGKKLLKMVTEGGGLEGLEEFL